MSVRYKDHTLLTGGIAAGDVFPMDELVSGSTYQTRRATGAMLQAWAQSGLGAAALSNDYNDLSNLPTLFDGAFSSLTGIPTTIAGYGITDAVPDTRTVNGHPLNGDVIVTPTDLGLVIGTDVQAFNADLSAIAALTPSNDDLIQRKAGAWTNRTIAQVKSDFGLAAIATSGSASDLSTGTVAAARGGAGTVNGILKANGFGLVSAAVAGADYLSATAPGSSDNLIYNNAGVYSAASLVNYSASGSPSITATSNASGAVFIRESTSGASPTLIQAFPALFTMQLTNGNSFWQFAYINEASPNGYANYLTDSGVLQFSSVRLVDDTALGDTFMLPFGGIGISNGSHISTTFGLVYQSGDNVYALGRDSAFNLSETPANVDLTWGGRGITQRVPVSAIADGDIAANHLHFYLDEAADALKAKWKESGGTLFNQTLANLDQAQTLTNKTLTAPSNVLGGVTMTLGSDASGDVYYRNSSGVLTRVAAGAQNTVFTMGASSVPSWVAPAGASVTIDSSAITSGTANRVLFESATNKVSESAGFTFDGTSTLTLGVAGTSVGAVAFKNATSGTITLQPVTGALGTVTLSLPATTTTLAGLAIAQTFTAIQTFDNGVTTGSGATAGTVFTYNSLTTGNGADISSSSVTTGNVVKISSTSTAAGSNTQTVLNVATSGANGTSSQTTFAAQFSNTHTGTSSVNVGISSTVSGGSNNYAARFTNNTAGDLIQLVGNGITSYLYGGSGGPGFAGNLGGVTAILSTTFRAAATPLVILPSGGGLLWASGGNYTENGDVGFVRTGAGGVRLCDGSTSSAPKTSAGNLLIGTSTGAFGSSAAGVLALALSTAPTTSPADTVQLYAGDAVAGAHSLYVRDEAGNRNRLNGLCVRNSAQFDKTSSTALANITGLSHNVEAGFVYAFRCVLQTTAAATGGVKFAVSGTATATSISYEGKLESATAVLAKDRATALDTVVGASTTATAGTLTIEGVIVVNAAGTLTIQFAQNASDGTASSVLANQYFQLIPIG